MSSDLFATPARGVACVALPVPVDQLFEYAVPAALADQVEPGRRVRVRLDRRPLTGVIVETASEPSEAARSGLRALEAVLDPAPALPAALLRILVDEAASVLCPVGIALAAALPPGSAPAPTAALTITPRGREALDRGAVRGETRTWLARLAEEPLTLARLRRAPDAARELLAGLERDRLLTRTTLQRPARARTRRVRTARLAAGTDVAKTLVTTLARAPRQAELLRALADGRAIDVPDLARRIPAASDLLRALDQRGLVEIGSREAPRELPTALPEADRPVQPTDEQARACATIEATVAAGEARRFLLHGVTGSGKTEVYLRAVAETLRQGRQALVLVPEITLTHQIVARLRARFGDALAVLHSGLRPGQRLEQWERLRRGDTPIAVGARSVLFAPLERLGLIVIDEEHDPAYKNDEGFRYHARRLAARRAEAASCPLVLGSATPSLETRLAAERGGVERIVLSHRIGGRPLPAVQLVDLAAERARLPRGRKLVLTPPLRRALRETLGAGGQAILFLNRRGFSTQITCFACGFVERCKHCDISLVYHAGANQLRCHYCDYETSPPEACTQCSSPENALLGIGTERLEEEVRSEFPDARIARLDRDVAGRRGATEEILSELRAERLDVLVGTQIVAKGHDFPGVRLVGVVNADLGLNFPDFRASERSFQLLAQVAGRAGRGGAPGRVIVQTYLPRHHALQAAARHDDEAFYRAELAQRRALGYPPCGWLARALVSGPEETPTRQAAQTLAEAARGIEGVEVLGPSAAPLARLRGRHRVQLLLKGPRRDPVRDAARRVLERAQRVPAPLRASIDVDPYDML